MIPPFLRRRLRDRLIGLIDARIEAARARWEQDADGRWAAERARVDLALQTAAANQANAIEVERAHVAALLEGERAHVRNLVDTAGVGGDLVRRITLVERLLGLPEGGAAVAGEAGNGEALERLLDTRLGQVEARLLAYVEGPFAERLAPNGTEPEPPR